MYIYVIFLIFNLVILKKINYISNNVQIYDFPDKTRKFHGYKATVIGGLIIYLNYLLFLLLVLLLDLETKIIYLNNFHDFLIWFFFPSFVFFLGLADDKWNLKGLTKFTFFIILFSLLLIIEPQLIIENIKLNFTEKIYSIKNYSFIFTIFCLLLFTNAFNMFDGINLQAGLYSLSLFALLSMYLDLYIDITPFLIGSIFYLYLNFKKNVFLGDGGAYFVSFMLSIFFIKNFNTYKNITSDEIFVIMLVPGLEIVRVFIERIISGKNPLNPDRIHVHHFLINKFKNNKINLAIVFVALYNLLTICLYLAYSKIEILIAYIIIYFSAIYYLRKTH